MTPSPLQTIVQLTDCHLFADPDGSLGDIATRPRFRLVLEDIRRRAPDFDFLVVTGDTAHDEQSATYEAFRDELGDWVERLRIVPGNHDDREALTRVFPAWLPAACRPDRIPRRDRRLGRHRPRLAAQRRDPGRARRRAVRVATRSTRASAASRHVALRAPSTHSRREPLAGRDRPARCRRARCSPRSAPAGARCRLRPRPPGGVRHDRRRNRAHDPGGRPPVPSPHHDARDSSRPACLPHRRAPAGRRLVDHRRALHRGVSDLVRRGYSGAFSCVLPLTPSGAGPA